MNQHNPEKPKFIYVRDGHRGINRAQNAMLKWKESEGYEVCVIKAESLEALEKRLEPFRSSDAPVSYYISLHGSSDTVSIDDQSYDHKTFLSVLQKDIQVQYADLTSCYAGDVSDVSVDYINPGTVMMSNGTLTGNYGTSAAVVRSASDIPATPKNHALVSMAGKEGVRETLYWVSPEKGFDPKDLLYFSSYKATEDLLRLSAERRETVIATGLERLSEEGILQVYLGGLRNPKEKKIAHKIEEYLKDIPSFDGLLDQYAKHRYNKYGIALIEMVAAAASDFTPNLSWNTLHANQKAMNALSSYVGLTYSTESPSEIQKIQGDLAHFLLTECQDADLSYEPMMRTLLDGENKKKTYNISHAHGEEIDEFQKRYGKKARPTIQDPKLKEALKTFFVDGQSDYLNGLSQNSDGEYYPFFDIKTVLKLETKEALMESLETFIVRSDVSERSKLKMLDEYINTHGNPSSPEVKMIKSALLEPKIIDALGPILRDKSYHSIELPYLDAFLKENSIDIATVPLAIEDVFKCMEEGPHFAGSRCADANYMDALGTLQPSISEHNTRFEAQRNENLL